MPTPSARAESEREEICRPPRVVKVQFEQSNVTHQVELYDGMCREDVYLALQAAAALTSNESFILTNLASGAIVPVSAALPNGMEFILRATPGKTETTAAKLETAHAAQEPSRLEPIAEKEKSEGAPKGSHLERDASASKSTVSGQSGVVSHILHGLKGKHLTQFEVDMLAVQQAMKSFAKVGNYQANERTFLAWERTALAALRTTFSILGLSATVSGWEAVLSIVTVLLAILTLMLHFVGYWRFYDMRHSLDQNKPPEQMILRARTDKWKAPWNGGPSVQMHLLRVDVSGCVLGLALVAIILGVLFKGVEK